MSEVLNSNDNVALRSIEEVESFLLQNNVNTTSKRRIRALIALSYEEYERYKTNLVINQSCKTMDIPSAMQTYLELKDKFIIANKETFYVLLSLVGGLGEQGSGSYPSREGDPPSDLFSAEIVFADMKAYNIPLSESCYTAMIRCYSIHARIPSALALFYDMIDCAGIHPKLRSFSSLFMSLAEIQDIDNGFKLYDTMIHRFDISPSEREYGCLLRLCVSHADPRFYAILEQMMEDILVPTSSSWEIFTCWFQLPHVGYHVVESMVSNVGVVDINHRQLRSIELDDDTRSQLLSQISSFALTRAQHDSQEAHQQLPSSSTSLSCDKETMKWTSYLNWLERHPHFDILIDGANVGYYKQNYSGAPSHVDYHQINWLLVELQRQGYHPLLILHQRHTNTSSKTNIPASYHTMIQSWRDQHLLYETPSGWNDDWFWMYACVKLGCHVVTNDEMRDHHFQMLSPRWFARWKERHVVHFSFGKWIKSTLSSSTSSDPTEVTSLTTAVGVEADDDDRIIDEPTSKKPRTTTTSSTLSALPNTSYRQAICQYPRVFSYRIQVLDDGHASKEYYFPASDKPISTWLCALPSTAAASIALTTEDDRISIDNS